MIGPAVRPVVAALEAATGRKLRVRHLPRLALSIGCRALAGLKPEVASLMGMALYLDTHPGTWDDTACERPA